MNTATSATALVMKPPVSIRTNRPLDVSAEFKVGVRSVPYLADHGFQDMIVLPGSFYIDTALRMERELGHRIPSVMRNAGFHNPIILSTEDTVVTVQVTDLGDGRVEYEFYEAGGEDGGARTSARPPAAKLEIERPLTPSLSPSDGASETGRGAGANADVIEK